MKKSIYFDMSSGISGDMILGALTSLAESKAHSIPLEKVHFHEVGALDSIIDITGSAILFDYLDVDTVLYGPFLIGSVTINYSHGICTLPVPAVSELIKGMIMIKKDIQQEIVTPTGAAVLTTMGSQVSTFSGKIIDTVRVCGKKNIEKTPGYSQIYIFN
jgi:pyridinium-3,5-bisthiocarboxylic acid mononucleotide nickel chelatase